MASRSSTSRAVPFAAFALLAMLLVACGGQPTPQPPAAASNVTATSGPGYVTITWQDNSDDETGFDVYRSNSSSLTAQQAGVKIGTVDADETTFVDMTVELEQVYEYSVVAFNDVGGGEPADAPAGVSVPLGVDLMVGTNNRKWSEDTNGTIFVVYFVLPDTMIDDQADVFQVSISGPPGWNEDDPHVFACAWDQCSRAKGFAVSTSNSITAMAGEYEVTVTAGGETFTATDSLTDAGFKFPRITDMLVTNASASGATVSWTDPPGTLSHYLLLYAGDYDAYVDSWILDATPSFTTDDQALADGIYGFEIVPLNADIATYPIKIEQFGLSYDYKKFAVGDVVSLQCASPEQVVAIPDAALLQAVRQATGTATGDITCLDMALLSEIDAPDAGIAGLEGLQYALNLTRLYLHNNDVSDASPLAGLTNLVDVNLNLNEVTDLEPFTDLTELRQLHLCCTTGQITDVSPLEGLSNLEGLNIATNGLGDDVVWPLLAHYPNLRGAWIGWNDLTDLSALADHPNLEVLDIGGSDVDDITPVANLEHLTGLQIGWATIGDLSALYDMTQLTELQAQGVGLSDISFLEEFGELNHLNISSNAITSLAPLVANAGIGSGDYVDVRDNDLDMNDAEVLAHIQALIDRGVDVQY